MTSILDDKLIALKLAGRPEFRVRLHEFLHSYGAAERPALVVQARPTHGSKLAGMSVDDTNLQKRFLGGVTTENGWWQGFQSMRAVKTNVPRHRQPAQPPGPSLGVRSSW